MIHNQVLKCAEGDSIDQSIVQSHFRYTSTIQSEPSFSWLKIIQKFIIVYGKL